jgi:AcrR family transcriptional regulator
MKESSDRAPASLRADKKLRQRRAIAQVAMRLFCERGFDAVPVADIARAAEVAENTVYNYFPSKEDLFFDRQAEMEDGFSRAVRARRTGESIAAALKRDFLDALDGAAQHIGLTTGMSAFWRMVDASPRLQARLTRIGQRAVDRLAEELAAEGLCAPDTDLTLSIASLAVAVPWSLHADIRRRVSRDESPESIRAAMRPLAEAAFALLSDGIGALGTRRPTPPAAAARATVRTPGSTETWPAAAFLPEAR